MTMMERFGHVMPAFVAGEKKLFIGGQWRAAQSGETLPAINPATGQTLCQIARGGAADIDLAVGAARKAFEGEWSRWTPHQRFRLMMRVHDLVEKYVDDIALIETLDMGAPITRTKAMGGYMSQAISFFAAQYCGGGVETLSNSLAGNWNTMKVRAPVGVVGGIIPWNAPMMSQWWIIGPTLASGCTAVIKPAEDASLTTLRMMEILQEAGVPDGVINLVTGYGHEAGARLAEHPDVDRLAFTGSVDTARKIVAASSGNMKRLSLELGGKSPDIVFADADMDKAVPGAAMGCFANTGQICAAGTRLFVERKAQDEFVEKLQAFAGSIRVGNGLDPQTVLGPIVSQRQLDRVMHYVDIGANEGARLACGGARLGGELEAGYFVQPTIFAGATNDMTIAREEIFGPVLTVIPFDSIEEVTQLANATPFGLAGGVWTQNVKTAHRMIHAVKSGTLWVNGYGAIDPAVGFGGYKLSGYGWKGSREHVDSFYYTKAVYMNLD